jgi:hypothetical protein
MRACVHGERSAAKGLAHPYGALCVAECVKHPLCTCSVVVFSWRACACVLCLGAALCACMARH